MFDLIMTAGVMKFVSRLILALVLAMLATAAFGEQPLVRPANAADQLEKTADDEARAWTQDSIADAVEQLGKAADGWRSLNQPERQAECLRKKARLVALLGDHDLANVLLKQALAAAGPEQSEQVRILADMSYLALALGDKAASDHYLAEADRKNEAELSSAAAASKYFAFGENSYYNRDADRAVAYFKRSQQIWHDEQDLQQESTCLLFLTYSSLNVGNYSQGIVWAKQAIDGFRQVGDNRGFALSNVALGHILSTIDDKQAALDAYGQAEPLFPAGADRLELARLYNGIGSVYEDYGYWDVSLNYREKALALFVADHHRFGELATLTVTAKLHYLLGRSTEALTYFARAQKLAGDLNDRMNQAVVMLDISDYYFYIHDYKQAKAGYIRFLASADKAGLRRSKGPALVKLGLIYEAEGNEDAATAAYKEAAERNRKMLNPMSEADALYNLSIMTKRRGDPEHALTLAQDAVNLTDSLYYKVANSRLKSTYISSVYERYELSIALLMGMKTAKDDNSFAAAALEASEKARARSMLEDLTLSKANFTADADPAAVKAENEIRISLNAKSDQLTELLSTDGDSAGIERLDAEISELQNSLAVILADLKQKSPIYSAIKDPAPFDVAGFQSQVLDDNSVLLEYSLGADESYLWAIGKTSFDSFVLPPRLQIESRIEKLRSLLGNNSPQPGESLGAFQERVRDAEAEYAAEARALSTDLLGPAAGKIAGKRLIVVPDGKIHYFPIAALPFPDSTVDDPILLTNEVVYEPSAATLMLLKKSTASVSPAQKDLFVVSDPVYSRDDERLGGTPSSLVAAVFDRFRSARSIEDLPRLPRTADEANSIVEAIGSSASTLRSGFAANRENVLNGEMNSYKIIHFATHGLLDEARPELSSIVLSLFDEKGTRVNNGFIRIQDVYAMNLKADLVVLSACDTGLGKEVKGEGLASLNNAFLQAGARSVVSGMWKVEDMAARQLMTEFYRGMASGLAPSDALRRAKIGLRNDPRYSSPLYWASFTIEGDFTAAPRFAHGRGMWLYLPGPVILALSAFYWRRRRRRTRPISAV